MNRMRETTTTTVSTTADHERNLGIIFFLIENNFPNKYKNPLWINSWFLIFVDALLEDLQTTVSRSNSTINLNGNVTGYREVRRAYTDGTPEGTVSEYQIEYLNPANSTQHIVESSYNNMVIINLIYLLCSLI